MTQTFDPYHVWLGIPPAEQPPSHYRLLALAPFEDAPEVIENAADRQMAHVRRAASGKHADKSQQILNEISAARRCLLQADMKSGYDAQLRAKEKPIATTEAIPNGVTPGIAATMEWTPPPKPPKSAASKKSARPPAPPKRKVEAASDADGHRWKGAPPEQAETVGVMVTDSPVRVAGGSNISRRARGKQSNTWILLAVIGLLATLPIIALLVALAMMNPETPVADSETPDVAANLTSTTGDNSANRPAVNPLPLPGVKDGSDDDVERPDRGLRRPSRDRDRPRDRDRKERDPFDDTPSFGEVELGSDSGGDTESQTLTISAKKTMIQLALLRLPSSTGTGIRLTAGQTVKLHIDGQIRVGGQAHDLRGPEGLLIAVGQREQPATQHFRGAADVEFTVDKPGELFLAVDDLLPFDNQGELTVEVVVED